MPALPEDDAAYAVALSNADGRWQAGLLPEVLAEDLGALVAAVRQQLAGSVALAVVDVAHEFFVVVRIDPAGPPRYLLSDAGAAVGWELAAQVLEALELDPPDDDSDEVEPAGDLSIFSDLGMDEMELGAVLGDLEAYADEMIGAIGRRVGFADAYDQVVDALVD